MDEVVPTSPDQGEHMSQAITLDDAIEEYLMSRRSRGLAEGTLKGDRLVLRQLLTATGNILLRSVEPRHIDLFFDGKVLQDSGHNLYLTRLRGFFKWARARNYIRQDPTYDRSHVKVGEEDTRLFVPGDRFEELLDAAEHPRDRIMVALGLYLFLRVSEAVTLTVGDVDLDNSEIAVRVHKTKGYDLMPICEELEGELRRWLTWYAEHLDVPLAPDMLLVPSKKDWRSLPGPDGKFVRSDQTRVQLQPYRPVVRGEQITKRALERLGYPTFREGGHTLRRSGARALFDTLRAEEGKDGALQQVKVMLHHKHVSMTEHYIGIKPERDLRDQRLKGRRMFALQTLSADNVIELTRGVAVGNQAGRGV
jgi:integrase